MSLHHAHTYMSVRSLIRTLKGVITNQQLLCLLIHMEIILLQMW